MSRRISIPFEHLYILHREIGVHRGREAGFREIFGLRARHLLPLAFEQLAKRVREAYTGRRVPSHAGWPAQHEALRWLVDRGVDGIYQLEGKPIRVRPLDSRYCLVDGNHRALALYVLGERRLRAEVGLA